ncbi:MAG: c-type cytochrome [Anaerolineae bacterium]|nr:c-type cytochrome [Anaerolineae bacterium]
MKKAFCTTLSLLLAVFILAACGSQSDSAANGSPSSMMGNGGMMQFHMAAIPDPYAGMKSPVASDQESMARGGLIYEANCATCHGDGGMGDGPGGAALDPSPAPIAHTSQMMSDAYLFWRVSEGGSNFGTAMISFKGTLTDQDRWDVINYIRALGRNEVTPQSQLGGELNDPAIQAAQQAEMLAAAVDQGFITQAEADFFAELHPAVDDFILNNRTELGTTSKPMMESGLDAMVAQGVLSQEEASQFLDIHNRLVVAGLMQ